MCFEFERLEAYRKELEKQEALKKSAEKVHTPTKPEVPDKSPEQEQPVPA